MVGQEVAIRRLKRTPIRTSRNSLGGPPLNRNCRCCLRTILVAIRTSRGYPQDVARLLLITTQWRTRPQTSPRTSKRRAWRLTRRDNQDLTLPRQRLSSRRRDAPRRLMNSLILEGFWLQGLLILTGFHSW